MEAHFRKGLVVSQGSDDVFAEQTAVAAKECDDSNAPDVSTGSSSLVRSEKGQQARDAYRSSGYGTQSGDNANESAAIQISAVHNPNSLPVEASATLPKHLLSDEACAALPQQNLTPDLNTEAQKCVENDFKPRHVVLCTDSMNVDTKSAVHNPAKREFEKPLHTNQNCSSVHTAFSLPKKETDRLNATGQQSLCTYEPNVSKNTALIDTKQTITLPHQQDLFTSSNHAAGTSKVSLQNLSCHQNLSTRKEMAECHTNNDNVLNHTKAQQKQQPLQQNVNSAPPADSAPRHLTPQHCLPVNCAQELIQPGSDTSTNKSAAKLDARTRPPFLRQDEMCGSRTISESVDDTNKVQISSQPPGQMHSAADTHSMPCDDDTLSSFYLSSSIGYQFDERILSVLETCARCPEVTCDNADCEQMRKELAALMDARETSSLNERQIMLLQTALYHMSECSHPKCPLTWCGEKIDEHLTLDNRVTLMKQRIKNYAKYYSWFNSSEVEFMKLNEAFVLDRCPLEGIHWQRMCMLKDSRKTILASPIRSDHFSEYKYWVIKKILTTEDSHHWDLFERLRDLNHKSIAIMLWAARCEHHLLVCHLFENLSLRDCLHEVSSQQIGLSAVCLILQQIMSAVSHLNNRRIVYLYWMSKNILVTCQAAESFCVKLSNFSCSALLDNYDGDHLSMILPPSIVPPELRTESTVELASDTWGLGCLLYEIVTGKQVWYEHRHLRDEDLKVLLGKNPVPKIPNSYPCLQSLFHTCWETDCSKRKTVRDLELL
ncbi:hypothetical protein BsWGS_28279 [Bradybaena similaris]